MAPQKSALADLKVNTIDEGTSLAAVLRQARVLAAELRLDPLKSWINSELNGYYSGDVDLPDFRTVRTPSLGTFSGPFGRVTTNVSLPLSLLPDEIGDSLTVLKLRHSVRELEAMADRSSGTLKDFWSPELVLFARSHFEMEDGSQLVEAWRPIPEHAFRGILDAVRNRLLEFLLELEEVEPEVLSSKEAIARVDPAAASNIFHLTISGNQNVVAAGLEVDQAIDLVVPAGDEGALRASLSRLGVPEDEQQQSDGSN